MIEKEKIEEIKRRTDIVDVITQYLPLKKVGKNYRALCPFHSEKAPSFYVSPEKGIYYCFGCQKGGNAINFLMEFEHLDFPDAIKKLARGLGIDIDTTRGLKYKEIYEVNELAAQFYSSVLSREVGKRGQNYLKERRIDMEKLKDFRLGYAPSSGGLINFVRTKGVGVQRLAEAGLLSTNRELFHDRLLFPIFNVSGRVIGFGGRALDDQVQPKYLNSPETPIFKKGDVLYGIAQTKETMRANNEALLVEGYFDLLSLYQAGIHHLCAPLGTSLTENQALLISRYAKKVNIIFDGDLSGIKAALRAIGILINAQVDVHVTLLPDEYDPDEFLRDRGAAELLQVAGRAPDFFHFYKEMVKVESVEQEIALIKDLIQIIGRIQDPVRLDRYLKNISRVYDIPEDVIKRALGQKLPERTWVKPKEPPKNLTSPEVNLMALILNNMDHFNANRDILQPEDFQNPDLKKIYEALTAAKESADFDLNDFTIAAEIKSKMFQKMINEERITPDEYNMALLNYKADLEEKNKIAEITEAQKDHNDKRVRDLMVELQTLKERHALKK
jgi:DNA primase